MVFLKKRHHDLLCFGPEEMISEMFVNLTYKETDGVFVYSSYQPLSGLVSVYQNYLCSQESGVQY